MVDPFRLEKNVSLTNLLYKPFKIALVKQMNVINHLGKNKLIDVLEQILIFLPLIMQLVTAIALRPLKKNMPNFVMVSS